MRIRTGPLLVVLGLASLGATAPPDSASIHAALDAQYRKLAEAHDHGDEKAIAALKTADFHSIGPDGRVADVQTMAAYTRQFLTNNKPPYNIRNTIRHLRISENGLIAVADVFQEASRMRDLAGKLRRVETSVEQEETWSKTPDGWKLKMVEHVHNQKRFVDGKRVDPTKPYDPNAPPFEPDSLAH